MGNFGFWHCSTSSTSAHFQARFLYFLCQKFLAVEPWIMTKIFCVAIIDLQCITALDVKWKWTSLTGCMVHQRKGLTRLLKTKEDTLLTRSLKWTHVSHLSYPISILVCNIIYINSLQLVLYQKSSLSRMSNCQLLTPHYKNVLIFLEKCLLFLHYIYCGAQLYPVFKLHWRRPDPISSLICTNRVRKGQAQYSVWG